MESQRGLLSAGTLLPLMDIFADPLDDVLGRGPRGEDRFYAQFAQLARILVGDDAAAENSNVIGAFFLQQANDLGKERHMRAGEDAQADRVDVFLYRSFGDHLRSLVKAGVDDLEAAITQRACNDLGAPIMPIETGFSD